MIIPIVIGVAQWAVQKAIEKSIDYWSSGKREITAWSEEKSFTPGPDKATPPEEEA